MWARRGIRANLYDARPLPGGLNTYGVAEYKLPLVESLREIEMLSQLGVEFHFNTVIDAQSLARLERDHHAIFLGIGLGAIHQLGVPGEHLPGVTNALDLIARYKSGESTSVPPRVVVVGAGPSGATTALLLARRGHEVVLVDRARFPRDKACGEGLMPPGVDALRRIGLYETVLATGARPLRVIGRHQLGRHLARSGAVARHRRHHDAVR